MPHSQAEDVGLKALSTRMSVIDTLLIGIIRDST